MSSRRWVVYAAAASLFRLADNMFPVAAVLLLVAAGAPTWVQGLALSFSTFPVLVTSAPAGHLVDRTRHLGLVLAGSQLVIAAVIVGFWMLVRSGHDGLPEVLLLLPIGAATPVLTGGLSVSIRRLAGENRLSHANTFDSVSLNGAQLAGPGIAAALAGLIGPSVAILATAGCAACAAIALLMIAPRAAARGRTATSVKMGSPCLGLTLLSSDKVLLGATIASVTGYGATGALPVLLPHFSIALGHSAAAGSALLSVFAATSLATSLTTPALIRRWGALAVVLVAEGLTATGALTWPAAPTYVVLLALVALSGLPDGPGLTAMFSVRQQHAPAHAYGRIVTAAVGLKVAAYAAVAAITPALLQITGNRGALLCIACLQLAGVITGVVLSRSQSRNREPDNELRPT